MSSNFDRAAVSGWDVDDDYLFDIDEDTEAGEDIEADDESS